MNIDMQRALRPLRHDDPDEHVHEELLSAPDVQTVDLLGLEAFKQKSVGIDIGSSTSHLIFSELTLRREGFSSRFRVTEREVLYQSPILLTPYVSGTLIDARALQAFIESTYAAAGVQPDDVDSGAIVITGEALKKENAQPIVEMFSREVGKFICAAAGHNHEAVLAAYGSGAVALSSEQGWRLLNIDVGGGTTKFALIDRGEVLETAAINVGARLIAFDDAGMLTRIEDAARTILDSAGELEIGGQVSESTMQTLAERMIESLLDVILHRPPSLLTSRLFLTEPISGYTGLESVDRVLFSGGVSEYVYGRDELAYGDLGPLLGRGIRGRMDAMPKAAVVEAGASGIRATVIGAGEYTIQASGNTSYISDPGLLPVHALQVVRVEEVAPEQLEGAIMRALRKFDLTSYRDGLALSLRLPDALNYPYLRKVADAIANVVRQGGEPVSTLFLIIDKDVAKTLGTILREEIGLTQAVIALDGIDVGDLDYVDIGRPMGATEVLPVTVKSLVFPHRLEG